MSEHILNMPPICAYCVLWAAKVDTTIVMHVNSMLPDVEDGTELSMVELHANDGLIVFRSGEALDLTGRLNAEEFMILAPLAGRIGFWELNGRRIAPSLVTYWQGTAVCGMHLLMLSANTPDDTSGLTEALSEG